MLAVGDPDEVPGLCRRLEAGFDSRLHVTRSLPHFCEILHPDAGKHKALKWLGGHLGVGRGDIAAFGNGYEDVEMLRWAGLGVAVNDGTPEAVAAADVVAPSLDEDGAAHVLEDLLHRGLIG